MVTQNIFFQSNHAFKHKSVFLSKEIKATPFVIATIDFIRTFYSKVFLNPKSRLSALFNKLLTNSLNISCYMMKTPILHNLLTNFLFKSNGSFLLIWLAVQKERGSQQNQLVQKSSSQPKPNLSKNPLLQTRSPEQELHKFNGPAVVKCQISSPNIIQSGSQPTPIYEKGCVTSQPPSSGKNKFVQDHLSKSAVDFFSTSPSSFPPLPHFCNNKLLSSTSNPFLPSMSSVDMSSLVPSSSLLQPIVPPLARNSPSLDLTTSAFTAQLRCWLATGSGPFSTISPPFLAHYLRQLSQLAQFYMAPHLIQQINSQDVLLFADAPPINALSSLHMSNSTNHFPFFRMNHTSSSNSTQTSRTNAASCSQSSNPALFNGTCFASSVSSSLSSVSSLFSPSSLTSTAATAYNLSKTVAESVSLSTIPLPPL